MRFFCALKTPKQKFEPTTTSLFFTSLLLPQTSLNPKPYIIENPKLSVESLSLSLSLFRFWLCHNIDRDQKHARLITPRKTRTNHSSSGIIMPSQNVSKVKLRQQRQLAQQQLQYERRVFDSYRKRFRNPHVPPTIRQSSIANATADCERRVGARCRENERR